MGGGGGGSDDGIAYQRQQEKQRQKRIREGMTKIDEVFGKFNDDFYDQRNKAYTDFATPQLEDQYSTQRDGLTFALARGGNLASSLSADKRSDLAKDFSLQKQNVLDQGLDYANQGRADVQQQKTSLVSLLQASADPDAAANLAQSQAINLSQRPAFSSLGQVLQNAAAGIGSYVDGRNTQNMINQVNQQYSSSASGKGSGRVSKS